MKNNKTIKFLVILFIIIFISIQFLFSKPSYTSSEDVYDVILFWGQSNMVGYCGNKDYEKSPDYRYTYTDSSSVKAYSKKSGIDENFLANSVRMNYVKINQTPNTVYEYVYSQNKLSEITENTENFGERMIYESGKLTPTSTPYSIQRSAGTNVIPQFAKTYYEKTGHKVIVVFAANGGEKISHFLPSTDSEYDDANNQMIYESMVTKYQAAIKYLTDNNYNIDRKVWVSFQGESDVGNNTTLANYKNQFLKVHNYLKEDLGITKGAIIQTSYNICSKKANAYDHINYIHDAQVQLSEENDDIVLGSDYAYLRYLPQEDVYSSDSYTNPLFLDKNGNKLPYEEAFSITASGLCDDGTSHDNIIHCTSAALCQIGKETAELLTSKYDITPPEIEVSYSTKNPTNKDVVVTLSSNEDIKYTTSMENNGWEQVSTKIIKKTYSENISKTKIVISDLSGNETEVIININNIDKITPVIEITYSTTDETYDPVTVTIKSNEAIKDINTWSRIDNNTLQKVYSKNTDGKLTVTIEDIAGNTTQKEIEISNIKDPIVVESNKYMIDNTIITMIDPNTTVDNFFNNIYVNTDNKKIINKDNKELANNDLVTTSSILVVDDKLSYTLIVKGDLNENGTVNISDLAMVQRKILDSKYILSDAKFKAGDIGQNNTISVSDLALIQKYILRGSF